MGAVCLFALILATIWQIMGFPVRLRRIEALVQEGAADEALPLLRALAKKHHGKLPLHMLLARVYTDLAKYRHAIEEWNRVFVINQRERELSGAEIARPLAECHASLGELREAQGVLLLALEASPGECGLRERLAEIYLQRGMPKHSIACYEILLKYDRENTGLLLKLASVQERAGDMRAALVSVLHIIRLDARNIHAIAMAARLYSGFGNHRSAEDYWRQLVHVPSGRAEGLKGLASCLDAQGGRDEEALEMYTEAMKYVSDERDRLAILYSMVNILIRGEALREALAILEEISRKDSNYRDVPYLIEQYKDLARDELVARFTNANAQDFRRLADDVLIALGVSVLREKIVHQRDLELHGMLEEGTRRETVLLYFARALSPINERLLQELADEMRVMRVKRSYVFSMAGYSARAKSFATLRSISLVGRDELKTMLMIMREERRTRGDFGSYPIQSMKPDEGFVPLFTSP
jgi:tetratricopeptide (TPR) repeat protein